MSRPEKNRANLEDAEVSSRTFCKGLQEVQETPARTGKWHHIKFFFSAEIRRVSIGSLLGRHLAGDSHPEFYKQLKNLIKRTPISYVLTTKNVRTVRRVTEETL